MSADFEHALTREILRTELLRVRAILVTLTVLLAALLGGLCDLAAGHRADLARPSADPAAGCGLSCRSSLFELSVLRVINARLAQGRDVPYARRYLGALIETSLPTVALYLQMQAMGPAQALAFVVPLIYFIFIILSTLRLDFWLSTFTGFVAAAELFAMAMFYRPAQFADEPAPDLAFHIVRCLDHPDLRHAGGRGGHAAAPPVRGQHRGRDRARPHHQPVRPARLAAGGRAADGGGQGHRQRDPPGRRDVRRFPQFYRRRPHPVAAEVVERLDGAFAVLVDILDRHGGIVNKFLGDGFLALFGAPLDAADPAHHAVAAAREMLEVNERVNKATSWPLRIGIGIHVGEVVAGNIGSPRRKEYTVIGDTVNFAARLEALNKEFNSQFLISAAVRDALGEDGSDAVSLGEVAIRGYDRPMAVWQLG